MRLTRDSFDPLGTTAPKAASLVDRRRFLRACGEAAAAGCLLLDTPWAAANPQAPSAAPKLLNWGLIGMGQRMHTHVELILRHPERGKIAAICDIREEALKDHNATIGQRTGQEAPTYVDYKSLLKHPGLNAVCVATPHYLHKPMCIDAMEMGCDVLCEKPLCIRLGDHEDIIQTATRTGRLLTIGYQSRYRTLYPKIMEMLRDKVIGDLKLIQGTLFRGDWMQKLPDPEMNRMNNWMFRRDMNGDLLIGEACHNFEYYNALVGKPPLKVAGFGGLAVYSDPWRDYNDHSMVVVSYEGGVKLSMNNCLFSNLDGSYFVGDHGWIWIRTPWDGTELKVWRTSDKSRRGGEEQVLKVPEDAEAETLRAFGDFAGTPGMHRAFFESVQTRRKTITCPEMVRSAEEIAIGGEIAIAHEKVFDLRTLTVA